MRKKLTFIVPILAASIFITIAGSGSAIGSVTNIGTQRQAVLDAIAKRDMQRANTAFSSMITEPVQNAGLDEAIYKIAKEYQYSLLNVNKAIEAHNYNIENFSGTKYGMLSHIEIIRSHLRNSTKRANAELEKWLNIYTNQPDQAMGIYQIACDYLANKKDEKALELFQFATAVAPDENYGILSQIRYDAAKKNYDAANEAAGLLIANSPDSDVVKQGILDLANYYREQKQFRNAILFYQAEIDTWDQYDNKTVPYRDMIYSYIDMNEMTIADSIFTEMQEELEGDTKLARANFEIASYYLQTADYEKSLVLHEYNVENYTDSPESILSQVALVSYYAKLGDEDNACAEFDKMLSIYENEKTLPKEIAGIGDVYVEIDNTEKARALYQQVLDEWPESEYVFDAKAGFIKADIHDDYDEAAMLAIDTLMEEYKNYYKLSHAVFSFGEQYWDMAMYQRNEDNPGRRLPGSIVISDKTKYYYKQARIVFEKLIENTPEFSNTYTASRWIAEIYRINEQNKEAIECYQSVIDKWPDYNLNSYCLYKIATIYESCIDLGELSKSEAEIKMKQVYTIIATDYPETSDGRNAAAWLSDYETRMMIQKRNETMRKLFPPRPVINNSNGGEK